MLIRMVSFSGRPLSAAGAGRPRTHQSHHMSAALPKKWASNWFEPAWRRAFQDEVRVLGRELAAATFIRAHPFPGRVLPIRCPGEITARNVASCREATRSTLTDSQATPLMMNIWQALFAICRAHRWVLWAMAYLCFPHAAPARSNLCRGNGRRLLPSAMNFLVARRPRGIMQRSPVSNAVHI